MLGFSFPTKLYSKLDVFLDGSFVLNPAYYKDKKVRKLNSFVKNACISILKNTLSIQKKTYQIHDFKQILTQGFIF